MLSSPCTHEQNAPLPAQGHTQRIPRATDDAGKAKPSERRRVRRHLREDRARNRKRRGPKRRGEASERKCRAIRSSQTMRRPIVQKSPPPIWNLPCDVRALLSSLQRPTEAWEPTSFLITIYFDPILRALSSLASPAWSRQSFKFPPSPSNLQISTLTPNLTFCCKKSHKTCLWCLCSSQP